MSYEIVKVSSLAIPSRCKTYPLDKLGIGEAIVVPKSEITVWTLHALYGQIRRGRSSWSNGKKFSFRQVDSGLAVIRVK